MKLTSQTIKNIINEFWRLNYSDDLDDIKALEKVLNKIDLTFVPEDSSQAYLEWKNEQSNQNSNTGGKQI